MKAVILSTDVKVVDISTHRIILKSSYEKSNESYARLYAPLIKNTNK